MDIQEHEPAPQKLDLASWTVSILFHVVALLSLAAIILPAMIRPGDRYIEMQFGAEQADDSLQIVELLSHAPRHSQDNSQLLDQRFSDVDLDHAVDDHRTDHPIEIDRPDLNAFQAILWDDSDSESMEVDLSELENMRHNDHVRSESTTDEIRQAEGPETISSVISAAIEGEMAKGDTLVVWLLDASISLSKDRAIVSQHMEEFYQSIDAFNTRKPDYGGRNRLMNAVVGYGAATTELVRPTRYGSHVCNALLQVPPDTTGLENVMSAVQKSAVYYRRKKRRRERMIFIVVTDESGDDTLMVEPTIQICQSAGIAVHVIGPTAVFGAERGSHVWNTLGSDGRSYPFLLPVKRGPDTSLPERPFFPYWHESLLPPWNQKGAIAASRLPWYGGAYRERLLSGVGPYALTRLALATGGSFTVLDREGDDVRFRLNAMRDYLPSYQSADEYMLSLQEHPLRKAVSNTAMLSHSQRDLFIPPRMAYMGGRSRFYPFRIRFGHIPPTAFRNRLKLELQAEQRRVMTTYAYLEKALEAFDGKEVDWDYEYSKEESRRWRAWYDLTKGRLLALSARCLEYNMACRMIPKNLGPYTNKIVLKPWNGDFRVAKARKDATEAEKILRRCSENNPGTPWQMLADWELQSPVGIQVEQISIPKPPPPKPLPPNYIAPPARKPPTFQFPNL